jgi:hypothetical protein
MEWLLEDSFGIEDVTKGSESTPHACARWFSCENGLFVLVVGIGSLIHLYSLVETSGKERSFKEELMIHRYKKITTIETRSYATPSELGEFINITLPSLPSPYNTICCCSLPLVTLEKGPWL